MSALLMHIHFISSVEMDMSDGFFIMDFSIMKSSQNKNELILAIIPQKMEPH